MPFPVQVFQLEWRHNILSGYHFCERLLRVLVGNVKIVTKKRERKIEREREKRGFEDMTLFGGFISGEI